MYFADNSSFIPSNSSEVNASTLCFTGNKTQFKNSEIIYQGHQLVSSGTRIQIQAV